MDSPLLNEHNFLWSWRTSSIPHHDTQSEMSPNDSRDIQHAASCFENLFGLSIQESLERRMPGTPLSAKRVTTKLCPDGFTPETSTDKDPSWHILHINLNIPSNKQLPLFLRLNPLQMHPTHLRLKISRQIPTPNRS